MAGGKKHYADWQRGRKIVFGIVAAVSVAYPFFNVPLEITLVVLLGWVTGYWIGKYITPDFDLIGLSWSEGELMRDFKIFGVIIVMWFMPYAYLMRFVGLGRKGHRNFFSHFPFVGSAIRLFWLVSPIAAAWIYFNFPIYPEMGYALAGILLGLSLADGIHLIGDLPKSKFRLDFFK